MGSGSLAPRSNHRTGEGQTAGKEGRASTRNCAAPRSKSYLTTRNTPGPQGPQARGRRRQCAGSFFSITITDSDHESNQANRAISTSKLNTSPRLHTWPINVVVYHGSQGRTRFEVGFSLRCFQRLSRPHLATLHCRWRDNSSTRGTSIPVLSY